MVYEIKERSYKIAKKYGIQIYPSTDKKYKIDAYKNGVFIDKFGANGMNDYPTYIENEGKEYADKRKYLYYKRHPIDYPKYSRDWLSKLILWS